MDELHAREASNEVEPFRAYEVTHAPAPPGVVVVALEGELDLAAAPAARARVQEVPDGDPVVLDFGAATFVDSAMLRELLRLRTRAGGLVLASCPPQLERLLELTQTGALFEVAPDAAAAITRLTGSG